MKATALVPVDEELDELVVERIAVFYKQVGKHLRELEAYKLRRGYCIAGMSCTRKAVPTKAGSARACPYHLAAQKAGTRLARWAPPESEYGRLRKQRREEERERERLEAEERKKAPKSRRRAA